MESFFDLPKEKAMEAYGKVHNPSLTDQLLYAILGQLDKINHQLEQAKQTETDE